MGLPEADNHRQSLSGDAPRNAATNADVGHATCHRHGLDHGSGNRPSGSYRGEFMSHILSLATGWRHLRIFFSKLRKHLWILQATLPATLGQFQGTRFTLEVSLWSTELLARRPERRTTGHLFGSQSRC